MFHRLFSRQCAGITRNFHDNVDHKEKVKFIRIYWFNFETSSSSLSIEFVRPEVLMQGKLIAIAYTLRTYWNQFSLGGICKQE